MIVIRVIGGLGNQMFQYALGRRLAIERDLRVKYDTTAYESYALHGYALENLSVQITEATAAEIHELTHAAPAFPENWIARKRLPKFLRRGRRYNDCHRLEAEWFRHDPSILAVEPPVYLDGYWQTEKYFLPIADVLRREFAVRAPLSGANAETAERIASCEAVSLHVRRGDYASDETTRASHGLCSMEYYADAVAWFRERLDAPHFFVFSDDPAWASEHLELGEDAVVVDHNDAATGHEDMRLMSLCRHHIVANSSFSWWGAWLNPSAEKLVLAPKDWMADPQLACAHICPESWVRR